MTWIHAVKRQGVIAVLSIGLAIPAVGVAGAALADSQGHPASAGKSASAGANAQGTAASKGKNADNGNRESAGNGSNGSSHGASESASAGAPSASSQSNGNSNAAADKGNGSSSSVDSPAGCPNSFHNSDSGHGANVSGAYDSTCNGSASGNGNGNGNATGKPCAGCVGNADDKNPPGQAPDGSDHNKGYECDSNHGIGRTNPAHTGCTPGTTVDKCPDGSAMTDRNGDGKVNGADCNTDHGNPCPTVASAAADHGKGNGNGEDKGNKGHDGKDNGKGKDNGNKGNDNKGNDNASNGKDCGTPGHHDTCPDGSAMTDTNHDGKVNGADCTVDIPVIHNGNPPEVLGLVITAPGTNVDAASAVRPASASLPFTGSNAIHLALIADLILLAGTLAIWASGYRRQGHGIQH